MKKVRETFWFFLWITTHIFKLEAITIRSPRNLPATLLKKENLAQVFSCEFCEISKNTFSTEHLLTSASVLCIRFKPMVVESIAVPYPSSIFVSPFISILTIIVKIQEVQDGSRAGPVKCCFNVSLVGEIISITLLSLRKRICLACHFSRVKCFSVQSYQKILNQPKFVIGDFAIYGSRR